jgi:hypothetical protein
MNGLTANIILAAITGEAWMGNETGRRSGPTHDEIARLAYHYYVVNGREDGHDTDDWLLAEGELIHHCA